MQITFKQQAAFLNHYCLPCSLLTKTDIIYQGLALPGFFEIARQQTEQIVHYTHEKTGHLYVLRFEADDQHYFLILGPVFFYHDHLLISLDLFKTIDGSTTYLNMFRFNEKQLHSLLATTLKTFLGITRSLENMPQKKFNLLSPVLDSIIQTLDERREYAETLDSYKKEFSQIFHERMEFLTSYKKEQQFHPLLSTHPLTDRKYKFVSSITLLTRVAMKRGVSKTLAYSLSDHCIQQLDNLKTARAITDYHQICTLQFFQLMDSATTKNEVPPFVTHVLNELDNALYEPKLSVKFLAEKVQVSPNYLSAHFKKITGVALSEKIQEIKINEGKKLLLFSQLPYAEIATKLNFSSQSYFIKIFTKWVKKTPKQYRESLDADDQRLEFIPF